MKQKKSKLIAVTQASPLGNVFLNIIYAVVAFMCLYPFLLVLGISFTSEEAINAVGYRAIPSEFSTFSYRFILENAEAILRCYGVTIFTSVVGTILGVLVNAFYAYALSRPEFRYRKFFTWLQFITMLFGGGLVPTYLIITQVFHLQNTIWVMIIPGLSSAWNIIVLRTFFQTSVPGAIIESARIDGASELKTFFRIVWPISLPGIATIALFTLLGIWNNYFTCMLYTSDPELQNLQLYLYNILTNIEMLTDSASMAFQQAGHTLASLPKKGARMAMCIVTIGPIVLAYPFFQKYFIQGLTIGSVKG